MTFETLGISHELLKAIADQGFEKPSEIQQKAIPFVLKGKDVIAGSKTGSGKTLAFGSGILHHAVPGKGIQALVLTPTRELAEQVAQSLHKLSKYKPLSIVPVYGGVSINPQIHKLETADVVIGTPGRTLDHLERGTINLKNVAIMVLDEADRMLDMGFIDDVKRIMQACPKKKQTLFFSATMYPEIVELSKKYMHEPVKVSVANQVDPSKLEQVYFDVKDNMKFSLLVHLLKQEDAGLVMVFCNSRSNTDFVAKNLKGNGIDASAIHGGLSQHRRNSILEKFHKGHVYVLVCTDVAARGLDIKGVSHVYNYDIPKDSKQYVHRIGRTARAGKEGRAINILSQRDHENFDRVLRDNPIKVKKVQTPYVERAKIQRIERNDRRRRPQQRRFGARRRR